MKICYSQASIPVQIEMKSNLNKINENFKHYIVCSCANAVASSFETLRYADVAVTD